MPASNALPAISKVSTVMPEFLNPPCIGNNSCQKTSHGIF